MPQDRRVSSCLSFQPICLPYGFLLCQPPYNCISQFLKTNLTLYIYTHICTHISFWFYFSGEPWLFLRFTLLLMFKFNNRKLEDPVALKAAEWKRMWPLPTTSCLLPPETPPHFHSYAQPCSAPGFSGWLVPGPPLLAGEIFSSPF